ncbi:LysR family transcriptional regulator [Maritimibacter sp. UBA3975]|uniref:LysR family transcriptional regulator n=1 Tax=Maritimibacter sp. UBA3975 TaxID=1946833 RepID=UPI000C0A7056|nr:LysR family transcriptional regulator [Maritimibacter sp. UBA3975]MAM62963.1 transcriptional regulator [Maritimibacter sp.]|tara:strand:- start:15349 stop:16266 length:918 start_codon:yes stop_codon:yes gene_type:complete
MDIAHRLKPSHMQLLLHIAETGQLQRAAQLCAMSQPAASRILSDIERQIGSPLFDRHPKGSTPTELGSVVIRHAKVVLQELDELETDVARHTTGEMGQVRVGAVTGPAVGSLIPAIRRIRSRTPDIEMTVEVGPSNELVRGLAEGRFDFVIARLPPGYDSRDFRMYPARSEEVALVVRPGHPLATRRGVRLSETLNFEWVIQAIGSPIRQAVEAAFHARGIDTPAQVTNSSSLLVMLAMLDGTDVIAPQSREVFDMLVSGGRGAHVAMIDLDVPLSVSPCFIIRNRYSRLSAAAERLFQEVLAAL